MGIFSNGKCRSKARLDGKTAVVTGGNNGIGFETSLELLRRGARVIVACRSVERGQAAAERLRAAVSDNAEVRVVRLDLASLRSVKQCAEELLATEPAIHLLINNAGIAGGSQHALTEDGYELVFQTNHLGHFLFTCLLLSRIKDSAPARIINVSSVAHKWGKMHFDDLHGTKSYNHMSSYAQSKLSNILFTLELQQRLRGSGVVVYSLHPGVVNTDILDEIPGCAGVLVTCARWSYKTPEQGAQTTLHCALDEKLAEQNGLYYDDCKVVRTTSRARNKHDAAKLWQISEEHVDTFLR